MLNKLMIDFLRFWTLSEVNIFTILWSILELLGANLGSCWRPLEAIFAPPGLPGAPLGSRATPGASQDPPRSVWESQLDPPGADLVPTWLQLEPTWIQLGPKLGPDWLKKANLKQF